MESPRDRRPFRPFVFAAVTCALAPALSSQITERPFDLIDVADSPAAPDHSGIVFGYFDLDPTAHEEAGGVRIVDFDNDGNGVIDGDDSTAWSSLPPQ